MRGNIKTAARSMRSELYAKIRSTTSASQVLTLITVIQRGNQDLAQLGTGDEISDTDLYEETLDVLQRIPDLKHVYQLARLSSSNIGDWTSLKPYITEVCSHLSASSNNRQQGQEHHGTVLSADRGQGRGGRFGRGRGRQTFRSGPNGANSGSTERRVPPNIVCWRCDGNHYSLPGRGNPGCNVTCKCTPSAARTAGRREFISLHCVFMSSLGEGLAGKTTFFTRV